MTVAHNLTAMYRKPNYPPARYVFYPLYRRLRREMGMPCALAYFIVYATSAVLHAALMLLFGHPIAAFLFLVLYLALGLAGVWSIVMNKKRWW